SAGRSVVLEEQLLDAEQKKFAVGTSNPINVIQVQRDLANAQLVAVQAQTAYGLAQAQLDQALGTLLEDHNIQIGEAKKGRVARPPDPIPDLTNGAPKTGAVNIRR